MNMALSFPIVTGEVVTEAHARICAEKGHATWTKDGVESALCPRCGENKARKAEEQAEEQGEEATFERIADLEWAAKQAKNETLWAADPMNNRGRHDRLELDIREANKNKAREAQARLFAALDALTPDQQIRYGVWRTRQF